MSKKKVKMVPLEAFKNLPYDDDAPIKKGNTVYKINSIQGDLYPNGTKGATIASMKNSKGGFNYLVSFKVVHKYENMPQDVIPIDTLCEIDGFYITENLKQYEQSKHM